MLKTVDILLTEAVKLNPVAARIDALTAVKLKPVADRIDARTVLKPPVFWGDGSVVAYRRVIVVDGATNGLGALQSRW